MRRDRTMNAMKQLYYDDVEEGMEIPSLDKGAVSLTTVVKFAAATGDFAPVHHDIEFARSTGLPTVILHGQMKVAYLCQLLTDWIGEQGTLKKLDLRIRRADHPGETLKAQGRVTNKYTRNGENYVECEVWVENSREQSVAGTALVMLPSRR
jgi:acyl dehydratase